LSQISFIGIAGNIAVGKTTLTKIISDRFKWMAYYESVDDNPYLEDFYSDMMRWSFHLQIYFLSKRFEMQRKIVNECKPAVQDRTIYEDVEIFARSLYEMGNMSKRDWDNYHTLFEEMTSYLVKPTLIIYLKASTDTLITRLKKRGRDYEKIVSPDYLHRLNIAYNRWVNNAKKNFSILTVEADEFDMLTDQDKLDALLISIREKCKINN